MKLFWEGVDEIFNLNHTKESILTSFHNTLQRNDGPFVVYSRFYLLFLL